MNGAFLDKILAIKREKVAYHKENADVAEIRRLAAGIRESSVPHRLRNALGRTDRINVIAEFKRASPSKGIINDAVDVVEVAKNYEDGGASAISVLTEEDFFMGSIDDLIAVRRAVDVPILRKDFVVDEYQIHESAAAGADAILLIVAALAEGQLAELFGLTENILGMDAIVEVHTAEELETAARAGAAIIGVNNRDLRTFDVSLEVSRRLIGSRPPDALMIAESGISTRDEIDELRSLGFNGFLIGESLMRGGDAVRKLGGLI
jgi:indole-3-glycerol phosphate synthase